MNLLIHLLVPLTCGLVFGAGLEISGMTDTRVVLGFLDITGAWDPSLLFVMVGALAITVPGFWLAQAAALVALVGPVGGLIRIPPEQQFYVLGQLLRRHPGTNH